MTRCPVPQPAITFPAASGGLRHRVGSSSTRGRPGLALLAAFIGVAFYIRDWQRATYINAGTGFVPMLAPWHRPKPSRFCAIDPAPGRGWAC